MAKKKENTLGFLGGILYAGQKTNLGFTQSLEGIADFAVGGLLKLFGADEAAEWIFENDWVDYEAPDKWYNPSKGWQVAGDVAGGIGTTIPALGATALVTAATGGTGTPAIVAAVAPTLAGSTAAGLSAAGTSTKEAYRESGQLTGKEFGYGALSGATEAGLELVTGAIGKGSGRLISTIAKSGSKTAAKTVAKSSAKYVIKELGKDFASEAFEEGFSTYISPIYKRMTYDPAAQNATWSEIGYSALVGGISGMIMGGSAGVMSLGDNLATGTAAVKDGSAQRIMQTAERFVNYENTNKTGFAALGDVQSAYNSLTESLKDTGGQITTVKQRMLLGELSSSLTAAAFTPLVEKSAMNILSDPEGVAARFSELGMTDENGKPLSFTAEDILEGIDRELLTKEKLTPAEQQRLTDSIRTALSSNAALATLAAADATGHIMLDMRKFSEAMLNGRALASKTDLNYFVEHATAEEKAALGAALGIEDWNSVDSTTLNEKVARFAAKGGITELAGNIKRVRAEKQAARAFAMPETLVDQSVEAIDNDGEMLYNDNADVGSSAILKYKSSDSYKINEALRNNETASNEQISFVRQLDAELENAPKYQGVVYRNLSFDIQGQAAFDSFMAEHRIGKTITYPSYTSTSKVKDGYEIEGKLLAHIEIHSRSGRDVSNIGIKEEQEVLLERNRRFFVVSAEYDGTTANIVLEEITYEQTNEQRGVQRSGAGDNTAQQGLSAGGAAASMQRLQAYEGDQKTEWTDSRMQGVSERNTERNIPQRGRSQESVSGGQRNTVRAGGASEVKASSNVFSVKEIDGYARENIKDYHKLSAPNQAMIRALIRSGRAQGFSEADILTYARVSARSGVNIVFSKQRAVVGRIKGTAKLLYSDGFYDHASGEIVINPEGERSTGALLIHELAHAIYKDRQGRIIAERGVKNMTDAQKRAITKRYARIGKGDSISLIGEFNAHYAEGLLGNKNTLERLLADKPTLKDKILDFFKGAQTDYSGDERLSREAEKLFKRYKKLFDSFSEKNQGNNATERGSGDRAYAIVELNNGMQYVEATENQVISGDNITKWASQVANYINNIIRGGNDLVIKTTQGDYLTITRDTAYKAGTRNKVRNPDGTYREMTDAEYKVKLNAEIHINELAETSRKSNKPNVPDYKNHRFAKDGFTYRTAYFKDFDGKYYKLTISVGENSDVSTVYNVGKLKEDTLPSGKTISTFSGSKANNVSSSTNSISQNSEKSTDIRKKDFAIPENFEGEITKSIREDILNGREDLAEQKKQKAAVVIEADSELARRIENSDKSKYTVIKDYLIEKFGGEEFTLSDGKKAIMDKRDAQELSHKANAARTAQLGNLKSIVEKALYDHSEMNVEHNKFSAFHYYAIDITYGKNTFKLWINVGSAKNDGINHIYSITNRKEEAPTNYGVSRPVGNAIQNASSTNSISQNFEKSTDKSKKASKTSGQRAKEQANRSRASVYDRKYAQAVVDRINYELIEASGGLLDIVGKDRASLIDGVLKGLNSYEDESGRNTFAAKMGRVIANRLRGVLKADSLDEQMTNGQQADELGRFAERVILEAYQNDGKKSQFMRNVEKRYGSYENLRKEIVSVRERTKRTGRLMHELKKLGDLKLGAFLNSSQYKSDVFKSSVGALTKINFRGNISVSGTRKIVAGLREWYSKENKLLEYESDDKRGIYSPIVAEMLDSIADGGNMPLTNAELGQLTDIVSYFSHLIETWNKVYIKGKLVEALPVAKGYIDIIEANKRVKVSFLRMLGGTTYAENFMEPMTVARRIDMYENGFFTEMTEELRTGAKNAQVAEMETLAKYNEFLGKNRNYIETATREAVEWRGVKISKMQLMQLYMTTKRRQAWTHLAYGGEKYLLDNKTAERLDGSVPMDTKLTLEELKAKMDTARNDIEAFLTDTDREYIRIVEGVYNGTCKEMKAKRDMERLGFTNALSDYYVPIRTADRATSVDTSSFYTEMDRASNSSFNHDTVKGAKNKLLIESADVVFRRHVRAVCQYAHLSAPIENFDRLFNLDISGNANAPYSIAVASENTWERGKQYFEKLVSDIQGISKNTEGMATLGWLRGGYAKYQLGANPKVWVTQLSSIFASSSILDADCISRGMFIGAEGIDEYSPLAKLRNNDNTAAMAQGLLDRNTKPRRFAKGAGRLGDVLMKPIGWMDRFVVRRIYGACQVQVEKNGGAKVGTVENKRAAGELLEKVILETQQNSLATERSKAMRSDNEFMRTITMFSSDSMKAIGRVIDGVGEVSVLKERIKAATESKVKSELEARLKTANRKARKAIFALMMSAAFMAGVAELFRWLYDKETDEDETAAERYRVNFIGNLLGGLPIARDIYSYFNDGFGMENYAYSMINDLIDSAKAITDTAGAILSGEATSRDIASNLRKMTYAAGQMFGVPTRNIYNTLYGLTKRFSPETAYKIDNVFYEKNYKNDLQRAIEADDTEMIGMLMSMLWGERMGDTLGETVYNELYALSQKGYKVMPRAVSSSITVDGEEIELSEEQQKSVRAAYSASQGQLERLFVKAGYQTLYEEQKTEAINYIYDMCYNIALADTMGVDSGKNALMSKIIGMDNLALLYVTTKGLTSDADGEGKSLVGSKRKKVIAAIGALGISTEQKLLLICAKGYALRDGDVRGLTAEGAKNRLLRYILSLRGLSAAEKTELAEMCGFKVKNGRIIRS